MASPQAVARKRQGWTKEAPECSNCFYEHHEVKIQYGIEFHKKHRCTLGNFATKPTRWCKKWKRGTHGK